MNKSQLIDKISKQDENLTKKQVEKMIDVLTSTIIDELKEASAPDWAPDS